MNILGKTSSMPELIPLLRQFIAEMTSLITKSLSCSSIDTQLLFSLFKNDAVSSLLKYHHLKNVLLY